MDNKAQNEKYSSMLGLIDSLRDQIKGFDEDKDVTPRWMNQTGVEDAIKLIEEGVIPSNIFNTHEWAAEARERYRDLENTPTILPFLVEEQDERGYLPSETVGGLYAQQGTTKALFRMG